MDAYVPIKRAPKGRLTSLLLAAALLAGTCCLIAPFFEDKLCQAGETTVRQQLMTLRSALILHDQQNRPLTGSSLRPLFGRYLAEMDRDPWGNDFVLDSNVGFLGTLGADAQLGGIGDAWDVGVYYRPSLRVLRACLQGSWGVPRCGSRLHLWLGKPYRVVDPVRLLEALQLRTTRTDGSFVPVTFAQLNRNGGHSWRLCRDTTPDRELLGLLTLEHALDAPAEATRLSTDLIVDFDRGCSPDDPTKVTRFGLRERCCRGGPLDPATPDLQSHQFLHAPAAYGELEPGLLSPQRPAQLSAFLSDAEMTLPIPMNDDPRCLLIPSCPSETWIWPPGLQPTPRLRIPTTF